MQAHSCIFSPASFSQARWTSGVVWTWLLGEPGHANVRNVKRALQGRQQQEKNGSGEEGGTALVPKRMCKVRKQHVSAYTTTT